MDQSVSPAVNLTPTQREALHSPDGVILDVRTQNHRVVVLKVGSQLRLHFADPVSDELMIPGNIMSRIDLLRPLTLLATYTQAMLLSLIWNDEPERFFMLGLGGGRIPLVLRTHFPQAVIDSTETEPALRDLAEDYFGVVFDEHQRLHLTPGREFLEEATSETQYDVMFIDGFVGTGWLSGYDIGTAEFYDLCKRRLRSNGVICVNLLDSDPLFEEKVATLRSSFQSAYQFVSYEAAVFYATDSPILTRNEMIARATRIQEARGFVPSMVRQSGMIRPLDAIHQESLVLHDDVVPEKFMKAIASDDPVFHNALPDEVCPCGSRLPYRVCHGRSQGHPVAR